MLAGPRGNGDHTPRVTLATVANVEHVSVLHNVVFAFQAQLPLGAGVGLGAGLEQRVPVNGLGADEVFLESRGNSAGGGMGARIFRCSPGAALVFADGE